MKLTAVQERVLAKLFPEMLAFLKKVHLQAASANGLKTLQAIFEQYDIEAATHVERLTAAGVSEEQAEQLFVDYVKHVDPEFSELIAEMVAEDNMQETVD